MNHRRDSFLIPTRPPTAYTAFMSDLPRKRLWWPVNTRALGGTVDSGGGGNRFLGSWLPLSFSQQADLILEEKRFPDLVLLWIGHNNLHWEWLVDPRRPEDIETGLQKMAANFRKDYARQLGRLVERAREQKQRRAFIVFGLVNFKSFFEARDTAERLRKENPKLYPYFEVDYSTTSPSNRSIGEI